VRESSSSSKKSQEPPLPWIDKAGPGSKRVAALLLALGHEMAAELFKGLGELSPDEFGFMIGPDMRLDPVEYEEGKGVKELLAFYMGKNTPDRQDYIIENLREDVDKQIESAVA
jgi:topoisomerase-4 subunit B